jgi:DNA repair exonuclease SbcCD ATPase subunit
MQLKRIRLRNVGPHEFLDWEFKPGVIGILGAVGSGKSNAINAAYAALTNDYSRFALGKEGCICQQAEEGAPSSIEVDVTHGDHSYYVARHLRPNKHVFMRDGDKESKLTKATEIAVAVEQQMCVNKALLDNYVFIAQWDMFAFIELTESELAKHFARLCGTTHAEVCWEELGKQVELDRGLSLEIVDNSDDLRKDVGANKKRLQTVKKRLDAESDHLVEPSLLETFRGHVQARKEYLEARKKLPLAEQKEEELLAAAKGATKNVKRAEFDLDVSRTMLREAQDKVDASAGELAELKQGLRGSRKLRSLRAELLKLKSTFQEPPKYPLGSLTKEQLDEDVTSATVAVDKASTLLDGCDHDDVVECPTCGTSTSTGHLCQHIEETREALPSLKESLKDAKARLAVYNRYRVVESKYDKWRAGYDAETRRLNSEMEDLSSIDEDSARKMIEELEDVVSERDAARKEAEDCENRLPDLRNEKQTAIANHVRSKQHTQQLRDVIRDKCVTHEAAASAKSRIEQHEASVEACAGYRAQVVEIKRVIEDKRQDLRSLSLALKQVDRARSWLAFTNRGREVLHRDRLPALVHGAVLRQMESGINDDLSNLDGAFYVESNEALGFTAHFQNGTVMPARGLSGGQKVSLALPFRLQVHSLFASQVGMLVLDEPTAGLDAAHVQSMVEVFSQLSRMARTKGFQIIVITHERELGRAFDQVFELESAV